MKCLFKVRFLLLLCFVLSSLTMRATAYVGYDSDKRVLVFFCSDQDMYKFKKFNFKYLWKGDAVENSNESFPLWKAKVDAKKVIFDESFKDARPKRCNGWFGFYNAPLEVIEGIENLNTSETTSLSRMFAGCEKLKDIDLSHFDTHKVTDMTNMFSECLSLTSLDLSSFDTSNVKDMSAMFSTCIHIITIDLSSFDTSKVTCCESMFLGDNSLKTIYVSDKWNTKNTVQNSYSFHMFDDCPNLRGEDGKDYTKEVGDRRFDFAGEGGLLTLKK